MGSKNLQSRATKDDNQYYSIESNRENALKIAAV